MAPHEVLRTEASHPACCSFVGVAPVATLCTVVAKGDVKVLIHTHTHHRPARHQKKKAPGQD